MEHRSIWWHKAIFLRKRYSEITAFPITRKIRFLLTPLLQVRARLSGMCALRKLVLNSNCDLFFIGYHKNQLEGIKTTGGNIADNFTLLDPVMSMRVRFQNKIFSRGNLNILTSSYLLILILNDYQ